MADIVLSGFRDIDSSSMDIVNKNVSTHAKKLESLTKNMRTLHLTLKQVHEREKSEKYEIQSKLVDDGKVYTSHFTDRNLFTAVDTALQKLINELD